MSPSLNVTIYFQLQVSKIAVYTNTIQTKDFSMKHIQEPPPRDKCTMSWWAGLCKSGRSYIQVGSQGGQKWMTLSMNIITISSIASHLLEAVGTFLLKWCRWPVWFPWQQGLSCAVSAGHTAHQCPNKDGPNTSIVVYRNDHMTCWNKRLYDSYLQCTMTCLAIWLALWLSNSDYRTGTFSVLELRR